MIGSLALLGALLIFFGALPILKTRPQRAALLAVTGAYVFWYWLPALNLLTVQYIGVAFFQITLSIDEACVMVLVSQLVLFAMLAAGRSWLGEHQDDGRAPAFEWIGVVAFISATMLILTRFTTQGTQVLVNLATGVSSARETADFSNLSTGAANSLMGLWEGTSLWLALFAIARHFYARSLTTANGAFSIGALTLLFVATGTRAVLLQSLVIAGIVLSTRAPSVSDRKKGIFRVIVWAIPTVFLFGLAASALTSRFSADTGYRAAGALAVIGDTFLVNNDMMRELAFVVDTMLPSVYDVRDFFMTPFSHMFPSFLGFEKHIPQHLLLYNELRAGIDLNSDEGNVFPGLVADFWLNFENIGLFLSGAFTFVSIVVIARLRFIARRSIDQMAYFVTGLSYVFFNFRNISGSFVLSILFGAGVLWLMARADGRGVNVAAARRHGPHPG